MVTVKAMETITRETSNLSRNFSIRDYSKRVRLETGMNDFKRTTVNICNNSCGLAIIFVCCLVKFTLKPFEKKMFPLVYLLGFPSLWT